MIDYHELIYALRANGWGEKEILRGYRAGPLWCGFCDSALALSYYAKHQGPPQGKQVLFLECRCICVRETKISGYLSKTAEKSIAIKYLAEVEQREATHG